MSRAPSIEEVIAHHLERYFRDLDGESPDGIYEMVLKAAEKPMLETVMKYAEGNQCRASDMLGINRNTLRKKLIQHGLA